MRQNRRIAALAFAAAATPLLSSCGQDVATAETMPPAPPATAVGTASGSGAMEQVIWGKDASAPPERKKVDFAPKFSYAFPETVDGQRTLWLVVADQSPDTASLDAADDRTSALRGWCGTKHANYAALQLDSQGKPMASSTCAGDGHDAKTRLSEDSTMGDRGKVELAVNDGKRVEGSFVTGVGSTTVGDKESIADITGDYRLSAAVAAPTLRDRVLADGDEKASGIPGAKAAFLKYWKAAGSAKSFEEMAPWFTPERTSNSAAQVAEMAQMGNMGKRMLEMYAKGHAETPSITAAKAIGAAAVLTSESSMGDAKQTCRTLLLQLQGEWKVGDERCQRQGKK
jgi:hypothetical protein